MDPTHALALVYRRAGGRSALARALGIRPESTYGCFDQSMRRVPEIVASDKIGRPCILRINDRDPEPPPISYIKNAGCIFLDLTIHDFDMARFLTGSEVEEVYAAAGVMVDPAIGAAGDVDTAVITLRFANGAIGAIDNSRRAVYGYDQRVEVFGSGGMVQAANNFPNNDIYANADGVHSARPLYFFLERYTQSFINEMQAFVRSIREDSPYGAHPANPDDL